MRFTSFRKIRRRVQLLEEANDFVFGKHRIELNRHELSNLNQVGGVCERVIMGIGPLLCYIGAQRKRSVASSRPEKRSTSLHFDGADQEVPILLSESQRS